MAGRRALLCGLCLAVGTLGFALGQGLASSASAATIDLNDFFADPSVTVAIDGLSAVLDEDPAFGFVLLANDPGLGDPEVIIAAPQAVLSFEFQFAEGAVGGGDEFGAFLIDAATGLPVGPAYSFFATSAASGTVSFNLGALVGTTLGLQFQLSALPGDSDLDARVTVANLRIEEVPVPAALGWVMLAVAGVAVAQRREAVRRGGGLRGAGE